MGIEKSSIFECEFTNSCKEAANLMFRNVPRYLLEFGCEKYNFPDESCHNSLHKSNDVVTLVENSHAQRKMPHYSNAKISIGFGKNIDISDLSMASLSCCMRTSQFQLNFSIIYTNRYKFLNKTSKLKAITIFWIVVVDTPNSFEQKLIQS